MPSLSSSRRAVLAAAAVLLAIGVLLAPASALALQAPPVVTPQQAREAFQAGRFQDAYVALRPALEAAPERPDLWFLLGQIVSGLGQPGRALQAYEASITLAPEVPSGYFGKGIVLLSLQRFDEAAASLERCLELAPNQAQVALYLGMARLRAGDAEGALEALAGADPTAPDYGEVVRFRTEALRTVGRTRDAVEAASTYLDADPEYQPVRYELSLALIDAGYAEDALQAMRLAAIASPPYPEAVLEYGRGLRGTTGDDRIEAAGLYRHALEYFPDNGAIRGELASLYGELGMQTDAAAEAARIVETAPDDPEALLIAGNMLLLTRRPEEALSALERAMSLVPDSPLIVEQYGLALVEMQRFEEALTILERALALDAELLESRIGGARAALYLGQPERAIELLEDTGPLIEEDPEALTVLGEAYVEADRFEDAVPQLQRAADLDTTLADPLYLLARAYRGIGRAEMAQTALVEFEQRSQQEAPAATVEGGAEEHRLQQMRTRAGVYLTEGRFSEAIPVLDAAIAERSDLPELFDMLALAYDGIGNSERAEEARARAAELRRTS